MEYPAEEIVPRVAVVIPCYRVTRHVLDVIRRVPTSVSRIYAVDDSCPDGSGDLIQRECTDPRVVVLRNQVNQGVGGAVMHGYRQALLEGVEVVVKIDGDGQMDPGLLPAFVNPILSGEADYTKGNRFFHPSDVAVMPRMRLFGNASLSLLNKVSSGYWDVFDPTNGYTAIGRSALESLNLGKISTRYFFETDILFRLGLSRAVVFDIPMKAHYADEESGLKITKVLPEFAWKHLRNFFKRIFYLYYLRDFSIASLELIFGMGLGMFGAIYGGIHWWKSWMVGGTTSAGIVVLSAVALLSSLQLLLSFFNFDIGAVPRRSLARLVRLRGQVVSSGANAGELASLSE
ncbi:glycosyltransferase family 2 protein [Pseudoxanthomonas winnipegensis]|uniref:glycosyltransferase family 2 protein n=1 Tax=Pseudoxanthomonas winnipegensis TaxID=2480810 RepID=UPI002579221E|nr:glycosyltransferase family 2 protein [Pseudoxanthomonas winnipegensis]WJI16261.1 glycosyltransferase family 2 protein [Pseudoxanthomonas winnipegensis]